MSLEFDYYYKLYSQVEHDHKLLLYDLNNITVVQIKFQYFTHGLRFRIIIFICIYFFSTIRQSYQYEQCQNHVFLFEANLLLRF